MKKLLVASHERSGTHFLINSIANNSGGLYGSPNIQNPSKDIYHGGPYNNPQEYKEYVYAYLSSYSGVSESKIFKTHHKAEFFKEYITELKKEYHILYIQRNPLDVLTSLYYYYKNCRFFGNMCRNPKIALACYCLQAVPATTNDFTWKN